ncbi:ACT-7 domain-containing protein [Mycena indigotica]|uniref:H/ACA ribonucleoprotein complex non-core subunit NAF1 n=1 Tax=Mycena indigotica TaxID=2126181 RepID=A0A8H6W6Z4_9AGAR|nr:ACT-7 domain-containing protein [Mycena indigotica]KAF7307157.1 ACT-7 domain-containing protein [Mycena indigotica]
MSSFPVPSLLAQDLLLIQDILGPLPEPQNEKKEIKVEDSDDIDSSGDEASEAEIHAELIQVEEESDSDSSVETSSSESESDHEEQKKNTKDVDDDEGESGTAAPPAMSYFQTKNEVLESNITVPDIEEVSPEETLEAVGEVLSVIDKTVIVKGTSSVPYALDIDTLLVFEDKKVLGYIYETFGPTTQPLYQVKFSTEYPIDPQKVQVSRAVYHVPRRSKFVAVDQLKRFRGSDASNMHDEEPADYELEFSDDEAEAEHKRRMRWVLPCKKEKATTADSKFRHSGASSSRAATPSPAQMRDQDMPFYETNPYADNSAYDDNYGAGPSSRPAPMPYDDPYSDDYTNMQTPPPQPPQNSISNIGRGRGRGSRGQRRGRGGGHRSQRFDDRRSSQPPPQARSSSPTSMAIARATGQYPDGSGYVQQASQTHLNPTAQWPDPSQFNFGTPSSNGFVQPHINPRFASAFGFGVVPQQPPYQFQPGNSWTNSNQWNRPPGT